MNWHMNWDKKAHIEFPVLNTSDMLLPEVKMKFIWFIMVRQDLVLKVLSILSVIFKV